MDQLKVFDIIDHNLYLPTQMLMAFLSLQLSLFNHFSEQFSEIKCKK